MSGLLAWPLIGVVGAAAAVLRVAVDTVVERRSSERLPVGTLVVNLSGTFALGLLEGAGAVGTLLLVVGTAGIGTYTTFSTVIYETERLLEEGDRLAAAANILASFGLGLLAVAAGWLLGRSL
ncbi:MAG TPA: CrcB family protein [Gaiellales bacterium]|nr:CrcB family protein [Gaiellales bacterium]